MNKIKKRQRLLAFLSDAEGRFYYDGPLDGKEGPKTKDGAVRFLNDYGFAVEPSVNFNETTELSENSVMVFSMAEDANKKVSAHFSVREFACNDGTDPVFIHPILPVWAESARTINGAFRPNSAYRTVAYNATPEVDGSKFSMHCRGLAIDIPAVKATPKELYDLFEGIMGNAGGLGIYDWGVHVDCRKSKSRWDYRGK